MEELILKAIKQFSMVSKGDTVTVALSGGADSVSLMFALLELKNELGINVNAAHLNHGIRGEEADRDQKFVEDLCKNLGVELFVEKADVPKIALTEHLSLELAARKVRYEFLERVAVGKVATAHTASDNLETMLFNLTRGTSLKGLCGIPAKRGVFIRPIIFCTRENVEDYCKQNNLSFVTDSTNLSDEYSRNKIRLNVVPVLKQLNPSLEVTAIRTALSLSEDNKYLENKAEETLYQNIGENGLLITDFDNIPPAVSKRVIKKYFETQFSNITLDNKHITDIYSICLEQKGKINLPGDLYAKTENGFLQFFGSADNNHKDFVVNIEKQQKVNNLFSNNLLDYDKIVGKLVVRTRCEGDSIRLNKRGCTKTLKKLFTENKIPNDIRNKLPVIADDKGVVWVYGVGVAGRCAVSENTETVYKINITEV